MIDKLKKNKLYIKYGAMIIFIAVVVICTVKIITYGEGILDRVVYSINNFIDIIKPIIYAALISYLLWKPIVFIEKHIKLLMKKTYIKKENTTIDKVVRGISILLVFIGIILFGVLIYNFLIPPMVENIKGILESIPEFRAQVINIVNSIVESLNSKNIDVTNSGELTGNIVNNVSLFAETLLSGIGVFLSNISSFVIDFVVTLILTIYFLLDKERLVNQLRRIRNTFLPNRVGNIASTFLHDVDEIVGGYIVGIILDATIVGIVSTVLLLIIKHPFAVLIGVIAGITNIIPYIGPVIGAGLAFIFGIFTSIPMGIAGGVLLLLYQQIDGNIIQPKIVGDKVGLAPVWVMVAVLVGGSYFGPIGMIISIPIAGLMRIYFKKYEEYKLEKNKEV
ncbi:MAG: AI-2E family transporter [Clostridium sp.]